MPGVTVSLTVVIGLGSASADHVVDYKKIDFSKWAIQIHGKPQRRFTSLQVASSNSVTFIM
jgi:hypothetical protein